MTWGSSRKAAIAAVLGFAVCGGVPALAEDDIGAAHWHPWAEIGGYLSTEKSRGEAALFVPLFQDASALTFLDLRGKLFTDDIREGNFAIGQRWMLDNRWNFGAWGGYDVRRSEAGTIFHQLSAGLEFLHQDYDVRVNGYLPLNDKEFISSTSAASSTTTSGVTIVGAALQMATTTVTTTSRTDFYDVALGGVDAEVGVRVPLEHLLSDVFDPVSGKADLRLYAGGFYFDHEDIPDPLVGPRLRTELRIADVIPSLPGSRLTLETEYRYDDVREHDVEGGFRLRIPFGGGASRNAGGSVQERRMAESLERDTDIVGVSRPSATTETQETQATEAVNNAQTGAAVGTVVEIDGMSAGGLATAVATAGANGLIIARGGSLNITAGTTLSAGQAVVGGGGSFDVVGAVSGIAGTFVPSGTMPTFTAASGNVVKMANGTQLSGVGITGTAQVGVEVATVSNVLLRDVNVDGIKHSNPVGVRMIAGSDFTMRGGRIANITSTAFGAYGLIAESGASNITVEDVAISDISGSTVRYGVSLAGTGTSGTASFKNVDITLNSESSNEFGYNLNSHSGGAITIDGGRIANVFTGIVVSAGLPSLKVTDLTINNFRGFGIDFDNGSSASVVQLDNVSLTKDPSESALTGNPISVVNPNNVALDLTIGNSTVSNFHSHATAHPAAIELSNNAATYCADISGNTFTGSTAAETETVVAGGTVQVVDAANFATNNTGGALNTSGAGAFTGIAGPCQTP